MGLCRPRVVNSSETLRRFDTSAEAEPADDYLTGLRNAARARWFTPNLAKLPWSADAKHDDEIVDARRHPSAKTFDGHTPAEERAALGVFEFAARMEPHSGLLVADLASRRRGHTLTRGRIEFSALAIARYGLRVRDVSFLLRKHPNSITKWLNRGLRLENQDPDFRERLDALDSRMSMKR